MPLRPWIGKEPVRTTRYSPGYYPVYRTFRDRATVAVAGTIELPHDISSGELWRLVSIVGVDRYVGGDATQYIRAFVGQGDPIVSHVLMQHNFGEYNAAYSGVRFCIMPEAGGAVYANDEGVGNNYLVYSLPATSSILTDGQRIETVLVNAAVGDQYDIYTTVEVIQNQSAEID